MVMRDLRERLARWWCGFRLGHDMLTVARTPGGWRRRCHYCGHEDHLLKWDREIP